MNAVWVAVIWCNLGIRCLAICTYGGQCFPQTHPNVAAFETEVDCLEWVSRLTQRDAQLRAVCMFRRVYEEGSRQWMPETWQQVRRPPKEEPMEQAEEPPAAPVQERCERRDC